MLPMYNVTFHSKVGLRLVEELRSRMKNCIKEDPIRPVAQIYEEQYNSLKDGLDGADREEFISLCPNLHAMERNLYRY